MQTDKEQTVPQIMDIYSIILPIEQLETPIPDDAQEFSIYITYQNAQEIIDSLKKLMSESEQEYKENTKEKSPILLPHLQIPK